VRRCGFLKPSRDTQQSKNIPQLFIGSGASKFADLTLYPQATLGVQGPL
jgi:hypothetical protein